MTEMPSQGDARAALRRVARQRELLADRLAPPLWYAVGQALALLVLLVLPGLSQRPGHQLSTPGLALAIVAAVVGLSLLDARLAHVAGVRLGSDRHRAYASSRGATLRAGTTTLVACLATWAIALSVSWIAGLALGLALVPVVLRARQGILAAVRGDIRAGRTSVR